jgi:hypothetical protein
MDGRPSRYLYTNYDKSSASAKQDGLNIINSVEPYKYYVTLAEVSTNNWALKIHHVTKNEIFNLGIPNLHPYNSIFIADESMLFGVDAPLFANKELRLKIDVGDSDIKYLNTINTQIKNETAGLAFIEAFVVARQSSMNDFLKITQQLQNNNIYSFSEIKSLTNLANVLYKL